VRSVRELNDWYVASADGRSLAVSSRTERRDGQLWGLGGLDWMLCIGSVTVRTVSAEDEVLPDLPVVRAGWPYDLDRAPVDRVSERAA
jgi:hypothetical protein